jgi:hypothetical protein
MELMAEQFPGAFAGYTLQVFLSSFFFFSHKAMTSLIVMLASKCFWWEIFSAILYTYIMLS